MDVLTGPKRLPIRAGRLFMSQSCRRQQAVGCQRGRLRGHGYGHTVGCVKGEQSLLGGGDDWLGHGLGYPALSPFRLRFPQMAEAMLSLLVVLGRVQML